MQSLFLHLMSFFYIAAGFNHFLNSRFYEKIIPKWLPGHRAINYISGACEIIFGILLVPESTRSSAAWLIIVLLIVIFPANIQMAIDFHKKKHPKYWLTIARLPLQAALIAWAWCYT